MKKIWQEHPEELGRYAARLSAREKCFSSRRREGATVVKPHVNWDKVLCGSHLQENARMSDYQKQKEPCWLLGRTHVFPSRPLGAQKTVHGLVFVSLGPDTNNRGRSFPVLRQEVKN